MHRRSFLKLLASSSTALAFPSIVRAETLGLNGKVAPSNRISLGFIGVGGQGGGHFNGMLNSSRAQITGICDVNQSHLNDKLNALKRAYGPNAAPFTSGDYRELLARPEIDAVWISTPDHWHALTLIGAAQAGKDIYAEKPLAKTIPEGQAMVWAVEQSGVVCQIGSQQRSMREFRTAVNLARNGLLGKITSVKVGLPGGFSFRGKALKLPLAPQTVPEGFDYDMWLGPAPAAPFYEERCDWNWRWNFDYGGGQMCDWIEHHYEIASWAMGVSHLGPVALKNIKANGFADSPLFNTVTDYSFDVHYANGVVISVSNKNQSGVRIEGELGWVYANRGVLEFSDPALGMTPISTTGFYLNPVADHTANFLDCIASRQRPISPIQESHRIASVAHLANAACRSGLSEINWNPDTEQLIGCEPAARYLSCAYRGPWQLPT